MPKSFWFWLAYVGQFSPFQVSSNQSFSLSKLSLIEENLFITLGLCYVSAIHKAPNACNLIGGVANPAYNQKGEKQAGILLLRCG